MYRRVVEGYGALKSNFASDIRGLRESIQLLTTRTRSIRVRIWLVLVFDGPNEIQQKIYTEALRRVVAPGAGFRGVTLYDVTYPLRKLCPKVVEDQKKVFSEK